MTEKMTETERLRALLDKRGVKHYDGTECTYWGYTVLARSDGSFPIYRFSATEVTDGVSVRLLRVSPEQAVEATLGRGTCRNISPKLGNDEFTCEECLARVYGSSGRWFDVNWEYHKFNFCPNCGRRVANEQ